MGTHNPKPKHEQLHHKMQEANQHRRQPTGALNNKQATTSPTRDREYNNSTVKDHQQMMNQTTTMMTDDNPTKMTNHWDLENGKNRYTNKDYGYEKVKQCVMLWTTT